MRRNQWRVSVAAVAVATGVARADTLDKASGGGSSLSQPNVKVTGIRDGQVTYTTAAGAARAVPVGEVQRMAIDGQPGFTAAEEAFAAGKTAVAMDAYAAALTGTGPDWLKLRSAQRLAETARTQHRYDLQVAAYAALVRTDPKSAADARPAAPAPNTPGLDAAQSTLTKAIAVAPGAAKAALLGVQLDVAKARGDKAGRSATIRQLATAGAASPEMRATVQLDAADTALDAKQYAQAETVITQNKALFTELPQQVDALYVLARANDGQLATPGPGDATKDVALAYLRVVAFGEPLPGRPHVAESLLRAAQLSEKLSDAKGAATLYNRLATDPAYAGTPAAAEAKQAAARLKK